MKLKYIFLIFLLLNILFYTFYFIIKATFNNFNSFDFNFFILSFDFSYLIVSIIFNIFIKKFIKSEKISKEIIAGFEGIISNKNILDLTENINHEISNPLVVIKYSLEKIKNNGKCDTSLAETSVEQIENILDKISLYKNIRYSNGNKTLYDIIEGAIKTTEIVSKREFNYNIDNKFKEVKLRCLTNGDLLNILINHFKNSLEANATAIEIKFENLEIIRFHKNKFVNILILDNGNGIPKEAQKKIFEANFSTKTKENTGIRGNGLYLNKSLLKDCGGDDCFIKSENGITIFKTIVPVV